MNQIKILLIFVLLAAFLAGCAASPAPASPSAVPTVAAAPSHTAASSPAASASATPQASKSETYEFDAEVPSPSLALSNNGKNSIYVALPRSYYTSDKRYPVLYILHGYGENYQYIVQMIDRDQMEKTGEFILVGVNGTTSDGNGSFYADSPVTGGWETNLTQEITAYVDAKYRTIAKPQARGLAGFSMGGSATVNIGLKHPDVFGAIYPMSPGLFDKNGLKKAMGDWDSDSGFEAAYGAAFSPDAAANPPYQIPKFDSSKADNAIVANWENGYGNLENKIKTYLKGSEKLAGIRIVYGKNDSYKWIPEGSVYFAGLLKQYNIKSDTVETNGRHSVDFKMLNGDMLQFFASTLQMKE